VHTKLTSLFGEKKVAVRETKRAVTPWGGIAIFVQFLKGIGYTEAVEKAMPIQMNSPNAIAPAHTFTTFLMAVAVGARRFAHAGLLRTDQALREILGIERCPGDDTIRNFFKRFTQGKVHEFYAGLTRWGIQRLPQRAEKYSLDLDSTVMERYGAQQGARKGYNPRRPGRPSHHPLLAVLAEAHYVVHGWLRSGNCSSGRGVVEFLQEAFALFDASALVRIVRADSGFFDDLLLSFLELRQIPYIVVARLTSWVKQEVRAVTSWRSLDEVFSVGEFRKKLLGWKEERRFVVVREQIREKRGAGKLLIDVPGYSFRVFVTSSDAVPEEIWRDYNRRADMEKRICELKHDLGADDFCLQEFYATEAAFQAVLLLFNLMAEFQRAIGNPTYRQPETLRSQVLLCGAILGRAGHQAVLYLSEAWGGWKKFKPLWESVLRYTTPTSPKLAMTGTGS
jgi:Transposase DDE domain group 1